MIGTMDVVAFVSLMAAESVARSVVVVIPRTCLTATCVGKMPALPSCFLRLVNFQMRSSLAFFIGSLKFAF
jgi:hypothetical protein